MRKKVLALLLSMVMFAAMTLNVFAHEVTEENVENGVCSLEEVMPRSGYCLNCGNFTQNTCLGDNEYLEEGPHRVFIDLIPIDCTVKYYISTSVEMCHVCYNVTQTFGYHYCYEVHTCSRGHYNICPMEATLQ